MSEELLAPDLAFYLKEEAIARLRELRGTDEMAQRMTDAMEETDEGKATSKMIGRMIE